MTLCPAGLYADESKWAVHRHSIDELAPLLDRAPLFREGFLGPGLLVLSGLLWDLVPGQGTRM